MPFPKAVMDKAFEELTRRRSHSRNLYQHRQQEISEKIPKVAQIDRELTGVSVSLSRAILSGVDVERKVEELRDANLFMQRERAALLTGAGYPADYLEMQHQCPLCEDTGFTADGMCSCMRAILKSLVYKRLGETSNITDCRFDNFRPEVYSLQPIPGLETSPRALMTQIYQRCLEYAQTFSPDSPSLFFQGATGLGKTHLSLAIAGLVIEKGYDVLYSPVQSILNKLEKERFSRELETGESLEFVLDCDLLVLDDLGAEFSTTFSVSTLYNIINARLIEKRPTIISTNLDFKGIESRYSPRILSRLAGSYKTFQFMGSDYRTSQR